MTIPEPSRNPLPMYIDLLERDLLQKLNGLPMTEKYSLLEQKLINVDTQAILLKHNILISTSHQMNQKAKRRSKCL